MVARAEMASTSMQCSSDRDQAQIAQWLENDMQGTGDDFFNEYISYDSADALQLHGANWMGGPPSPSMLLDGFGGVVANSSSNQDIPYPHNAAASDFPGVPSSREFLPPASQQHMDPASLFNESAIHGNLVQGSNSDSDLLSLGEISLNPTTPSSPPTGAEPKSNSPRKQNFVESIITPLRKMKNRAKPYKLTGHRPIPPPNMTMGDKQDSLNQTSENDVQGTHEENLESQRLPPSPPLTLAQQQPSPFVHGVYEDPFLDPPMLQHATSIHQQTSGPEPTPINTPALSSSKSSFYEQSFNPSNPGLVSFPMANQHQHAVSMAGEWPMEGIMSWAPGAPMTPHYPIDAGNAHSPGHLWEAQTGQMAGGLQHLGGPGHTSLNLSAPMHQAGGEGMINDGGHHQGFAPQAHMQPYMSQSEMPGLGIHMPQPRRPQSAVLNNNNNNNPNEIPPHAAPTMSSTQQQQQQHHHHHHTSTPGYHQPLPVHPWPPTIPTPNPQQQQQHQQPATSTGSAPTSHRRPRPRAPSSGLRHHNHSPRKQPSLPYLREESQSPTPKRGGCGSSSSAAAQPHLPPGYQRRRSSSALGVRKRRSWQQQHSSSTAHDLHQQHNRRTSSSSTGSAPPPTTASSNTGNNTRHRTPSTPSSSAVSVSLGGGGGGIGFVNYTPHDSKTLMTGVAPSGSSKTKARREKEAADRRKKMEEAVRMAGGNLEDVMMMGAEDDGMGIPRQQGGRF